MKTIILFIASLTVTATLVSADGIPVDRKTGKVTVPHTIVSLTAEQIEETQTLGTFTLTPGQWREIRAKSPQCPKRFRNILPVTWNDCTCGFEDGYVIALSRDRIAVKHDDGYGMSAVCSHLLNDGNITLRLNERGEFHFDGQLIPFPTLLKAFAAAPDDATRNDEKNHGGNGPHAERWLYVELPTGTKPSDAVFESRLKQIAAAADKAGFIHGLFREADH